LIYSKLLVNYCYYYLWQFLPLGLHRLRGEYLVWLYGHILLDAIEFLKDNLIRGKSQLQIERCKSALLCHCFVCLFGWLVVYLIIQFLFYYCIYLFIAFILTFQFSCEAYQIISTTLFLFFFYSTSGKSAASWATA